MTIVERRLWQRLRAKQLGVKFRRQHPISPYIADFACISQRLVIEVDGDTHVEAYDDRRDHLMRSLGWRVMRIAVGEVDEDVDSVVAAIECELIEPGTMLDWAQRMGYSQPPGEISDAGVVGSSPPNPPRGAGRA